MSVKNVLWFATGLVGGVVLAHVVNRDPRGHEVLAQVDARITEFTDRINAAYHEQEARFAGPAPDGPAPSADDADHPAPPSA
ncbi:ATPase [Microbacterium sp. NPDC091313]